MQGIDSFILESLISQPAIKAWAIASIVIALKTFGVAFYTSSIRMRKHVYSSPEDFALQKQEPKTGLDDDVERARRIHQNDLENGLPFVLVGFVYALTDPSTLGIWLCYGGFTVSRILHTVSYAKGLMPHRTLAYMGGVMTTLWMAISSLVSILF